MMWDNEYAGSTDNWLGDGDGGDEDYDCGQGIDCGDDGSLDDVEYGGSYKDDYYQINHDHNAENDRKYDGILTDAEEDYNFGYGGNRHNRESGERFYGLGRWRHRE